MKSNKNYHSNYHCTVLEQKHLVAEMTQCDKDSKNHGSQYACYLKATKESRNNKACMFS
jgi:hypothetical protein